MTQVNLNSRWSPMDKRIDEIAGAESAALHAHGQLVALNNDTTPKRQYEKDAAEITKTQLMNQIKNLIRDYPEIVDAWPTVLGEYKA